MLYRLTSWGHCSAWGPLVQPRGFVHHQVHDFLLALLSRQIHGQVAWRLLTPELTPFNIFTYLNYLDLINMCIADFDKWRFNVWQPVSHSSHWLTVIQEESHLQMSKTRMNSEITCFNKNVLRWWWQRHVQNSSSWTSRKPWRRERDIKHIFKSGNPSTHWLIDSVELDRNGQYHKRPDWTSWNCTDCDCRGKLFKTIQGCLWLSFLRLMYSNAFQIA